MKHYFNEFDPFAAQWLRNLIAAGHLPAGDVDVRSIVDVEPDDLVGYAQCHFFAGIGGWSLALQLAGWPDDREVWTGSCPCQPFSHIGQRKGVEDERHLWPEFFRLIRDRRPAVVFGEQVASKDGREWLAGVRVDLEDAGYAVGAADLCSAGVSAPHIRQRLYWVGDADNAGLEGYRGHVDGRGARPSSDRPVAASGGALPWDAFDAIADVDGKTRRIEPGTAPLAHRLPAHMGLLRAYGNAINPHLAAQFIAAFEECRP